MVGLVFTPRSRFSSLSSSFVYSICCNLNNNFNIIQQGSIWDQLPIRDLWSHLKSSYGGSAECITKCIVNMQPGIKLFPQQNFMYLVCFYGGGGVGWAGIRKNRLEERGRRNPSKEWTESVIMINLTTDLLSCILPSAENKPIINRYLVCNNQCLSVWSTQ